jgi:hypothetical protein
MSAAKELVKQIINLDANVVISRKTTLTRLIEQYTKKIGPKYLWQLVVIDRYQNRRTLRAYYYNCEGEVAKRIHRRVFKGSGRKSV